MPEPKHVASQRAGTLSLHDLILSKNEYGTWLELVLQTYDGRLYRATVHSSEITDPSTLSLETDRA